MRSLTYLLFFVRFFQLAQSFLYPHYRIPTIRTMSRSHLFALTERQEQFWEDVQMGLLDIEAFYKERGQTLNRIWAFTQSAQGLTPYPPKGYSNKHQPSEEFIPGLTAQPYWEATNNLNLFPWASKLEENSHLIIQEFKSKLLLQQGEPTSLFAGDSAWQNNVMGQGWSAIRLQRLGMWNVQICNEFPKTFQLLQSLNIPLAVRGVCFARQAPGSGVQPHSDGRNFILTSHLGIMIPQGCWIQVADEVRTWEEGKLTTMDTSFEHSTGNPTESDRYVLIIDFWHPELTEAERAALEYVYNLRNKFESGNIPFRRPKRMEKEQMSSGITQLWNTLFPSTKN